VKGYDTKDLWRFTDAIRKVFSEDKRHELALVLRFTRMWAATDYLDRGILAREWAAGNRVSSVQRTDSGTNADGGYVTDRGEGAHHTLDTLDLEIACALLPMDFHHFEIPTSVLRRAKEIVASKEQPWKSWSTILRNQPGVLSVNRAAIFNLVRIAPENIHLTPAAHLEFVSQAMTAEFNSAVELLPLPASAIEAAGSTEQPQVANLGPGIFTIDGLINESQPQPESLSPESGDTTSNVQMEKTHNDEIQNSSPVPEGQDTAGATEGGDEIGFESDALNNDTEHQNIDLEPYRLFTHLMLDLETMGKKPGAPVVSIGAVFFAPDTGETGAEFYQVISLESGMSFGAAPDASTILWWLKQSPQARSEILVDDAVGLVEALEQFDNFIADNAANGSKNVQLWGNGSSFDCTLIEAAYELADIPFPIGHWNYRDVRTVVEMGKAVGLNCRYEIPFEGDQHHALADARHQVKYVSAIWQHLTAN
jgi:exodeoxyribonuclease VIII